MTTKTKRDTIRSVPRIAAILAARYRPTAGPPSRRSDRSVCRRNLLVTPGGVNRTAVDWAEERVVARERTRVDELLARPIAMPVPTPRRASAEIWR